MLLDLFCYYICMPIDWTKIYHKYKGLWVALAEDEVTVLGAGKTVQEAIAEAKKKSDKTPYLTLVPEKMVSYVGML